MKRPIFRVKDDSKVKNQTEEYGGRNLGIRHRRRKMSKVFGIGLPKTGTTSLHIALQILGYRSCAFAGDKRTFKELREGNYRLSVLRNFDAVSDIPIPAIFAQLDEFWPKSKFILTIRNLDNWLESCRKAHFNRVSEVPEPGSLRDFYRTMLYGCPTFNEARFRWIHHAHRLCVEDYFKGDKFDQLLIMDVTNGDGWVKLCKFLNRDVPNCEFPHANPHCEIEQPYRRHKGLLTVVWKALRGSEVR